MGSEWCARCGTAFENGKIMCDCAGDHPVDPAAHPQWQADWEQKVENLRTGPGAGK